MKKYIKIFSAFLLLIGICTVLYVLAGFSAKKAQNYDDKTEQFKHLKASETIVKLENKESGIYYFGFPTCPWCIELLPVLDEALKKEHTTAFVVNTREKKFTKYDDERLETFFLTHTDEKELTVPFVVVINSQKKIKIHLGTLDNHDATKRKLTHKEKETLSIKLKKLVDFYKK